MSVGVADIGIGESAGSGATATGARLRGLLSAAPMAVLWLILAPLIVAPLVMMVVGGFLKDHLRPGAGLTLATVSGVFGSGALLEVLARTLAMALAIGVLSTLLGAALAWFVAHARIRREGAVDAVIIAPLFLSPFITTVAWVWLAAPYSVINHLLEGLGPLSVLKVNIMSVSGIVFVLVTHYAPYAYIFIVGAIRNGDANLEAASYLCGRGAFYTATRIALPLVRPAMLSAMLFITIMAMGMFSVPAILGAQSTFHPLAVEVYRAAYGYPADLPRAAAIGTLLTIVTMLGLVLYRRTVRHARRYASVTGRQGRVATIPVSRAVQRTVWVFLAVYTLVTVVVPYTALVVMSLTQYRTVNLSGLKFTAANWFQVGHDVQILKAVVNSSITALAVVLGCVILAVPLTYLADRIRARTGGAAMYVATAPLSVPGIVLGTGMIVMYVRSPIYGTLALLTIAYVAHYLTHATRLVGNGLAQIDIALEEAAQVSGSARPRVLRTIVAPILRPSMFAACALIFVFVIREVDTAVMLYSPDSLVLSVLAWSYVDDGSTSQAAVVGIIQTGMMLAGILLARFVLKVKLGRSAM